MDNFTNLLKKLDKAMLILIAILACISLTMIASTALDNGGFLSKSVLVQAIAYCLGAAMLVFFIIIDYKAFGRFERIIYIASIAFLLTVYIPGLGLELYSARSWIDLKITTFQPSEVVKISFVILMGLYLSKNRHTLTTLKGIVMAALYGAPFILIVLKEDLGSAIVFSVIWVCMVFYAGIDYKLFGKFALAFCLSLPIVYQFMADYQKSRIQAFLHPNDLSLPGNYHVWQSKVAIGSGGFTGSGLFEGSQKQLDFVPVQQSDFIFSVICEELGLLGGLFVIAVFALLLYRILLVAREALDLYGALIAIGFLGMFGFQCFENIAMTMGIMPVTGITLPFISAGGSSILANMMAVGLVLSVGMRSRPINF